MSKVKLVIKFLEVAVNIIVLISAGKEIAETLKKRSAQSITKIPKTNAV